MTHLLLYLLFGMIEKLCLLLNILFKSKPTVILCQFADEAHDTLGLNLLTFNQFFPSLNQDCQSITLCLN